ncbi:MAG: acyltransferase [Rhodospirillaceae bacterium]|nr:acyltransferase [Rhodospirillaceae bacterium]
MLTQVRQSDGMSSGRIECLDGLRGVAAIWVLVGHALLLCGWRLPVLARPDLAVDLFMMLSGFLMVFQYTQRKAVEPWHRPRTWCLFWTRRFFRIAPLYYVLLAIALLAGPNLGAYRDEIAQALPQTGTVTARYLDQSWQNVIAHLTFVFGFDPYFSYSTPLPDWSIGLEMAFYAAFPCLMIAAGRFGFPTTAIVISGACLLASLLFSDFFRSFKQPSLLAIKLPIFWAGMLVAASLNAGGRQRWVLICSALLLCLLPVRGGGSAPLELAMRVANLAGISLLVHAGHLPQGSRLGRTAR